MQKKVIKTTLIKIISEKTIISAITKIAILTTEATTKLVKLTTKVEN